MMCNAISLLFISSLRCLSRMLPSFMSLHMCAGITWEGAGFDGLCLRPPVAALAALELMARFHKGFQLDPRRLPSPAQAEQALASPVDHSQVHAVGSHSVRTGAAV
jgi:hypothetical protein